MLWSKSTSFYYRIIDELAVGVGPEGKVYVWLPHNAKVTGPLQRAFADPPDPLERAWLGW